MNNTPTYNGVKRRSLSNYCKQHEARLRGKSPRTLTEARFLAFGPKKSQHGLLGKDIKG